MARVVLHIGTHKTGSTAVQEAFAANRRLLRRHGVVYPSVTFGISGHHGLAALWNRSLRQYDPRGGAEAAWRSLGRRYAGEPGVLVLSSEELSRVHGPGRVEYGFVRDALSGFERVDVLCLVRDQVSFLQSSYLENAKPSRRRDQQGTPLPPWSRFLARALSTPPAPGRQLDHNLLLDRLDEAFGPDRVHVVPYDRAREHAGGAIGLVLGHVGAGPDPAALSLPLGTRLNVTGDPLSVWAAAQISAPGRPDDALVELVRGVVVERFGPRTTLYTTAEIRAVRERFEAANRRLEVRLAERAPGFALPFTDLSGATRRGRLDRAFWIEIARRLRAG